VSGGRWHLPRKITNAARVRLRWWTPFVGFAVSLIFPTSALSKDADHSYLLLLYGVGVLVALYLCTTRFVPYSSKFLTRSSAALALVLCFSLLLGAFLYIHPEIDTDGFKLAAITVGASDSDDAIDVALKELLSGHYPYYEKTFLGNPLSPMPGALLLAIPFYVVGESALQNIFWLATFSTLVAWRYRDIRVSAWVTVLVLLLSPNVVYTLLQGSDHISNGIYVLVFLVMLMGAVQQGRIFGEGLLWAALLGLGLSSRLSFLFVIPVVFLHLRKMCGIRRASLLMGVTLSSFLIVTAPFVAYDPYGFSPLHAANFLSQNGAFPWAPTAIPIVASIFSVALGLRRANSEIEGVVSNCFLVQLFLIGTSFVLGYLAHDSASLQVFHAGLLSMFFGIFAFGPATIMQCGGPTNGRTPLTGNLRLEGKRP
jgi:hypothetical protein